MVKVPPQSKITAASATEPHGYPPESDTTARPDGGRDEGPSYDLVRMSVPTRTVPVPAGLVLVAERVEHRLAELLDTEIERWGALDDDLVEPLLVLRRFVVGCGKR